MTVLDMPFCRGAGCDTDHHLVAAKVRERYALSKQRAQNFDMERFYLCRISELEFRKQYQIKISNRSAALENLSDSQNINRDWENMKENIKTSATGVKVSMN